MRRTAVLLFFAVLMLTTSLSAQDFSYCADMNEDGSVNLSDLVWMLNSLCYEVPPTPGRGDIDFRDGRTLGDIRYLGGYLFQGYPEGGCPPFAPYSIEGDVDTVYLPAYDLPAGSGSFMMPIVIKNTHFITDFVLPFEIQGMDLGLEFDSLQIPQSLIQEAISNGCMASSSGTIFFTYVNNYLAPGINLLGTLYFHYYDSPGGTVSLDTATVIDLAFPHYVYGDIFSPDYSSTTIATPAIRIGTPPIPTMTVAPSTLDFETLVGYPNPDPKQFSVLSDGGFFSWTLTHPAWLQVDQESGVSGQTVTVTPDIQGLSIGTHTGTIVVSSTEAMGSPRQVTVRVIIKPQYPSLDANCDGIFNVSDIVLQVQYIFGSGQLPCDPCTGEPLKK